VKQNQRRFEHLVSDIKDIVDGALAKNYYSRYHKGNAFLILFHTYNPFFCLFFIETYSSTCAAACQEISGSVVCTACMYKGAAC
jgi:hypothetical protein